MQRIKILSYLKERVKDNWLIGYDSQEFYHLTHQLYQELIQQTKPPKVLLVETNPIEFLASFLATVAANCQVFLANPNWITKEWEEVIELVKPNMVIGKKIKLSIGQSYSQFTPENTIMIPTGGSSGRIHFAIHTWKSLIASVVGFSNYFDRKNINSFCVLPLYHVSGLMQFIRSFITGGKFIVLPYKALKSKINIPLANSISREDFFISLVPTQLQFLLENDSHWLSKFSTILLGGAPASIILLDIARKEKIPLALTYGMTETASGIAILKTEDFLKGNNSNGKILPHAKVEIYNFENELLKTNHTGIINISSESLFLGYYPEITNNKKFETDDLGWLDKEGYLHIKGRQSQKIITGGENVFPIEVEEEILATGLVKDVCVIGLPHPQWGEAITAIYVAKNDNISVAEIQVAMLNKLSKYKHPKYWCQLESLPRNSTGKINYQKIANMAQQQVIAMER